MIEGIDVTSQHVGRVQWATVARVGITFALIRCGEGESVLDAGFGIHAAGAGHAKIARAATLVSDPKGSAIEQARRLARAGARLELPPCLELRRNGASDRELLTYALAALDELEQRTGRLAMVSLIAGDFERLGASDAERQFFGARPLRIQHHDVRKPDVPKAWFSWAIWQGQGADGRCLGVVGPVGRNVSRYASQEDFVNALRVPRRSSA